RQGHPPHPGREVALGHRGRALRLAALACVALALPARAEDLAETIVVSAARASESAGEASGAVTAIPGKEIARAGARGRGPAERRVRRLGLLGRGAPARHPAGGDRARSFLGALRLLRAGR